MTVQLDAASERSFRRSLELSFGHAAERFLIVKSLRIGARCFQLRFASAKLLERFLPALAGIAPASLADPHDFRIDVWDSDSTSTEPPRPCWSPADIGANGQVRSLDTPAYRAAFNLDSFCLSVVDAEARHAHFWTRSALSLPAYECAAPLRTILAWSVQRFGLQLAHAGCVANGCRGVLLVGRGGSGKSTSALSCLGTGLRYLGDDYCALGMTAGALAAHALYRTGKLEPSHLRAHLPGLAPAALQSDDPLAKALLYLDAEATGDTSLPAQIEAIVLPIVGSGSDGSLSPCSPASALTALGPSSVFQLPGLSASTFHFLAEATRSLPCYTLSGGSPARVQAALWGLIS